MSMILTGELVENFGRDLPIPYIRRISINDEGIDIHLSVFLIKNNEDITPLIEAVYNNINLYVYLTVEKSRLENIISGNADVIDYTYDQDLQTQFREETVYAGDLITSLDNIFSSTIDTDGALSYTYLADDNVVTNNGIIALEFRITKSISLSSDNIEDKQTIAGLWQNYFYKLKNDYYLLDSEEQDSVYIEGADLGWPNGIENGPDYYQWKHWEAGIYVGSFSSTIDLQDEEKLSALANNKTLMSSLIGQMSYETAAENIQYTTSDWNESYANLFIPSQKQIEYMTEDNGIYSNTPIRTLSQQYHTDEKINRNAIISGFASLIRPANDNYQLENMNNQIAHVLEEYAESPDLLIQLNLLRDLFPSKTSTTKIGKLYIEFRRMLYKMNNTVKEAPQLSKRVIRNIKIIDERMSELGEYTPPSSAVSISELESLGSEYIYPTWLQTIEYDDVNDLYTGYGFFMFDYQKALYTTSAIAQVFNMQKLINLLGIDFTYASFCITEANIFRCQELPCESLMDNWTQILTYMNDKDGAPSYPRTKQVRALNSSGDNNNMIFPYETEIYGPSAESSKYGFAVTSQLPMLIARPYSSFIDQTSTVIPGSDYRLLLFEYQDFFRNLPSDDAKFYGSKITIRDSTKKTVVSIDKALSDSLNDLSEYVSAANSLCSFNNITEQFNNFFVDGVMDIYSGTLETAPWNTAPVTYFLYHDLLYDTYGGDLNTIMENAAIMIQQICPETGTITALQSFYERMESLYETMNDEVFDILDSYSSEREITYTLPVGSGTPWPTPWTTAEFFCESDSDCASGEKCWTNQKCVSKDYCTMDSQCTDLYGSDYECDLGINKCVAIEEESKGAAGPDLGDSEEGEKEPDTFDDETTGPDASEDMSSY